MKRRFESDTETIVTGVVIRLDNSDATHLSYALNCYRKETRRSKPWPWLDEFVEELDEARGSGCKMGPRVIKKGAET